MTLPETDVARVRRWVAVQNERMGDVADELRIEMDVDSRAITILECRPPCGLRTSGPSGHARRSLGSGTRSPAAPWALYWPDRNSRFHRYDDLAPTPNVERLLAEIDADPTCIFWG